jgi:hypothetical protein
MAKSEKNEINWPAEVDRIMTDHIRGCLDAHYIPAVYGVTLILGWDLKSAHEASEQYKSIDEFHLLDSNGMRFRNIVHEAIRLGAGQDYGIYSCTDYGRRMVVFADLLKLARCYKIPLPKHVAAIVEECRAEVEAKTLNKECVSWSQAVDIFVNELADEITVGNLKAGGVGTRITKACQKGYVKSTGENRNRLIWRDSLMAYCNEIKKRMLRKDAVKDERQNKQKKRKVLTFRKQAEI